MVWYCVRCFGGYEVEENIFLVFKDFFKNKGEGSYREFFRREDLFFFWEVVGLVCLLVCRVRVIGEAGGDYLF